MYFKIIKNDCIVDVCNTFARLTRKNKLINCSFKSAQFLLGRFPNRISYRLNWLLDLPEDFPSPETVEAQEITEQEYNELLKKLEKEEPIEYVPPVEDPIIEEEDNIPPATPILTYAELVEKLNALSTTCEILVQQNRLLEDCILEMSTQVYQ